jgi:hypothetical protein
MTTVALTLVPEVDDPRMSMPFVVAQVCSRRRLPVEINGVESKALVDSGAARSQIVDRPGLVVEDSATKDSVGAFGMPMKSIGRSVVSCRLAGIDAGLIEVDVVSSDLARQSNLIGQDVVGQFRCMYQLADGVMTLDAERPAHTRPIHLSARRLPGAHLERSQRGRQRCLRHRRLGDRRGRALRRTSP